MFGRFFIVVVVVAVDRLYSTNTLKILVMPRTHTHTLTKSKRD